MAEKSAKAINQIEPVGRKPLSDRDQRMADKIHAEARQWELSLFGGAQIKKGTLVYAAIERFLREGGFIDENGKIGYFPAKLKNALLATAIKHFSLETMQDVDSQFVQDLLVELEDLLLQKKQKGNFLFLNTLKSDDGDELKPDNILDRTGMDSVIAFVDDVNTRTYKGGHPITVVLDASLGNKDEKGKVIITPFDLDPMDSREEDAYLDRVVQIAKSVMEQVESEMILRQDEGVTRFKKGKMEAYRDPGFFENRSAAQ